MEKGNIESIRTIDYLIEKKVISNNKVNRGIIKPIAMLLALTDYKIYLLNLYYKTCGRRIICDKYDLTNLAEYNIFMNKYLREKNINDIAESRIPILKSLNASEEYLINNYQARISLLNQKISADFIDLYNYARSLKYIIMGGNDGIFNSLYLNKFTTYYKNLFSIINGRSSKPSLYSNDCKYRTLKDISIIESFYEFYKSILYAIDYSELNKENNQVSQKVTSLFTYANNDNIYNIINNMTKIIMKLYNLSGESYKELCIKIEDYKYPLATFMFTKLEENNGIKDTPIKLIKGKIAMDVKFYYMIDNNKDNYVNEPMILTDFFKENLKFILLNETNSNINNSTNKINYVKDNNKSIKVRNYFIIKKKITLKPSKNKITCDIKIIDIESYNIDEGTVIGIITVDNIDDDIRVTTDDLNLYEDTKLYNDIYIAIIESFRKNTKLSVESTITFNIQ